MNTAFEALAAPLNAVATLAARLLLAYLFAFEGWGKIGAYADVQAYMVQFGVEPRLLPLVIALEIGGGAALAIGFATRPAALAIAVFSLAAALLFHHGAEYSDTLEFRKDFAIAGGLLALAAAGAGAWSLDACVAPWLARRAPQAGAGARSGLG